MNFQALLNSDSFRPEPQPVGSRAEASSSVPRHHGACSNGSGQKEFSTEAASVLDEVRRTMELNPQEARVAALRLVTLLTLPGVAEPTAACGGLAPWQKRKVDRYMRENCERPVRLETLAKQVLLSVSHFCRAFKESFGDTPHAFIIGLRLERAKKLMLATEEPLSHIAIACGLADQAHLSKLFRLRLGETPNAWRRRNLTDVEAESRSRRANHIGCHPGNL